MDAETDLTSASRRLNAALTSKGLLDEGNPINFADGQDARKIINLIYNLVQKHNRNSEVRENLVNSLHEQKEAEARLKKLTAQAEARCETLERQLSMANVQKDSFKVNLKTLEVQNRSLQEEINRQKTMLQQIRAQDATERRKRDQQILRMKEKAGFDVRRSKPASMASGKLLISSWSSELAASISTFSENSGSVAAFKEQFSNVIPEAIEDLHKENSNLMALIRETALTLNIFTGEKSANDTNFASVLQYMPTSFSELSIEINNSLVLLKEMLNDPRYVSIEEIQARDQMIVRLKKELDVMTSNWKDAIQTMDEWNTYMDIKDGRKPNENVLENLKQPKPETAQHSSISLETSKNSIIPLSINTTTEDDVKLPSNVELKSSTSPKLQNRASRIPLPPNLQKDRILRPKSLVPVIGATSSLATTGTATATTSVTAATPPATQLSDVQQADKIIKNELSIKYPWDMLSEITSKVTNATPVKNADGSKPLVPDMAIDSEFSSIHKSFTYKIQKENRAIDAQDVITPMVNRIIEAASVSVSSNKNLDNAITLPTTKRRLFSLNSSPSIPIPKLEAIESSVNPKKRGIDKLQENDFEGFSPIKLPKKFRFDN
ncbi:Afadin and alpha-actinin-binding-domain-containing protein [Lipomyces japonicus]|uniref:Afadin and alpha-actinin-binding-domain-containing protein n=1 Tax=Lipomyces japonicus TaxID=56871 RepID=UPI0034CF1377